MKSRTFGMALLAVNLIWSGAASAEDIGKSLLKGFLETIGEEINEGIGEEFDKARQERKAQKQTAGGKSASKGFCQVWQNGSLIVQQPCRNEVSCQFDGTCISLYWWPNKMATRVIVENNVPTSLNGQPTSLVAVGRDACMVDGPTDVFCYTYTKQSPQVEMVRQEQFPAPPEPSIQQQANVPIVQPPQPQSPPASFELLLEEYANITSDLANADPQVVAKRCRLGTAIAGEYAVYIDAEMKSLIVQQLERDKCLG